MTLIDIKNEQNPAVSMQSWYPFLLVQNLHSCVQTLIFVCKLAFCRRNRLLTSCVFPKRNKIGYWITPKESKIGVSMCVNVRHTGVNNAQKMSQIGASFTLFHHCFKEKLHIIRISKPVEIDQFRNDSILRPLTESKSTRLIEKIYRIINKIIFYA